MQPSAAGDLGGQHLSQRPSPPGLKEAARAKPRLIPSPARPASSLTAAVVAWSYTLKNPKGKPSRMLPPQCAACRASQEPALGGIRPFIKGEELAANKRGVCSHRAHRFSPSSPASLPAGTQFSCKGADQKYIYIYLYILEMQEDAKTSSQSHGASQAFTKLPHWRTAEPNGAAMG